MNCATHTEQIEGVFLRIPARNPIKKLGFGKGLRLGVCDGRDKCLDACGTRGECGGPSTVPEWGTVPAPEGPALARLSRAGDRTPRECIFREIGYRVG